MITALFFTSGGILLTIVVGWFLSAPKFRGAVSDHFDGKRFINPGGVEAKGMLDVFKWMITRKQGHWKKKMEKPAGVKPPPIVLDGFQITFINHSTFLIQTEGLNIITDPVYSNRVSPFSWAGPKRMTPPGIAFDDLPKIDVLLLSHNHYDHLDIITVKKLWLRDKPRVITSMGVGAYLKSKNISVDKELDWWDEHTLNGQLQLLAVPAQHFSGRGMFDRDATLWCGYVLRRKAGNIYFVGDTAYNQTTFKEIAERCSPIRLAMIPIGAYNPEWFMSPIHCNPEGAVKIHLEVKSQQSIGMHFGTFPLADDSQDDPVLDLEKVLQEAGVDKNKFRALGLGETIRG